MFMKEAGAVLFRSPVMTLAEPDTVQYSLGDEVICHCLTDVVKGIISEDKSSSALTIYISNCWLKANFIKIVEKRC